MYSSIQLIFMTTLVTVLILRCSVEQVSVAPTGEECASAKDKFKVPKIDIIVGHFSVETTCFKCMKVFLYSSQTLLYADNTDSSHTGNSEPTKTSVCSDLLNIQKCKTV